VQNQLCLVYIDAIIEGLTEYIKNKFYKDNSVGNLIKGLIVLDSLNNLLNILILKEQKVYAKIHNRVARAFTARYQLIGQLLYVGASLIDQVKPETYLLRKQVKVLIKNKVIITTVIKRPKQEGFLNIIYSKRNIFATVSNFKGKILGTTTTGLLKAGRGRRRNLQLNIKRTASNTVNQVFKSKLTDIVLVQKGKTFNKKKRTFKRILLKGTTKRVIVSDLVRPAVREHNGSRPVKVRRR
jgi:ribosomal protein S11